MKRHIFGHSLVNFEKRPLMLRVLPLPFFFLAAFLMSIPLSAQDPDLASDEAARMEEIFRTSDQPGAIPTGKRKRDCKNKRVSVPKGAFRIGCVCMDDSRSDTHSAGSCSGHGGVRYWVYRTVEGDTAHVMTARHEKHPHAMNAAELSELSQKRSDRTQRLAKAAAASVAPVAYQYPATPPVVMMPTPAEQPYRFGWGEVLAVGVAGIFLYSTVRLILRWADHHPHLFRYALRHLLRHRKRPAPRPNRPDTDPERLP